MKTSAKEISAAIKIIKSNHGDDVSSKMIATELSEMCVGTLSGKGVWNDNKVDYFKYAEKHDEKQERLNRMNSVRRLTAWIKRGLSGDELIRAKSTIDHLEGLGV